MEKPKCSTRLRCGHQCPLNVHPTVDPDHENVMCEKPCQRTKCLDQPKHKCKLLCYEECKPCDVLVENYFPCGHNYKIHCKDVARNVYCRQKVVKNLPCGHSAVIACSTDPKKYVCTEKCSRILKCSHPCKSLCKEKCGKCKVIVEKTRHCGCKLHMRCLDDPKDVTCAKCDFSFRSLIRNIVASISTFFYVASIATFLCVFFCCLLDIPEKVENEKSFTPTQIVVLLILSYLICLPFYLVHLVFEWILTLPWQRTLLKVPTQDKPMVQILCRDVLPCGHRCRGSSWACRQGRVHVACSEQCGRIKVCGHPCTTPCAQACASCEQACPNRCEHSRCPLKCASPCEPCMEPCPWQCKHHKCELRCWEFCVRPRCDKACLHKLACGHLCIGVCGEKCPSLCRLCDGKELGEFILSGYEENEDALFIHLDDCGHCIEVKGMDRWMEGNGCEIQMKRCPRCKAIIWHSRRYGNIIRRCIADTEKVKMKLLGGSSQERRLKLDYLIPKLIEMGYHASGIPRYLRMVEKDMSGSFVMSDGRLTVIENQLNVLAFMKTISRKANKLTTDAVKYLNDDVAKLNGRLMKNRESLTEFEVLQIGREVKRIYLFACTLDVQETLSKTKLLTTDKTKLLCDVTKLFQEERALTDDEEADVERIIRTCKMFEGITSQEKIMIVNAMNLRQGHWYKCPRGHIYAIGECGEPMERAKCPECSASIGGERHALESSNTRVTTW